jgi:hypothetical protein
LPAYDGRKSIFTAGSLPFESEEFTVTLVDPEKKDKERSASILCLGHFSQFEQLVYQCSLIPMDLQGRKGVQDHHSNCWEN